MADVQQNMEQIILEVAEELFLDKGYALTSTTEIAKKAGCNQALIHYYFRTKENLFQKLFEAKFIQFATAIDPSKFRGLPFEEKLKFVISNHIEMVAKNKKLPFLILSEINTNPERFSNVALKIKELSFPILIELTNDLDNEIKAGRIRQIDPIQLLINIVSLNVFMFLAKPIVEKVAGLNNENFKEFVEARKVEVFEVIWRSLRI